MRILSLFLVVLSLAGCASARLPTCDGKHRRPLNVPAQANVTYPSCGSAAQGDHHAA